MAKKVSSNLLSTTSLFNLGGSQSSIVKLIDYYEDLLERNPNNPIYQFVKGYLELLRNLIDPAPSSFNLTSGVDIADTSGSSNGGTSNRFKFTNTNETVNGEIGTFRTGDTLRDGSSSDKDVFNLKIGDQDGINLNPGQLVNIETVNLQLVGASGVLIASAGSAIGLSALNLSGSIRANLGYALEIEALQTLTINATGVTGGPLNSVILKGDQDYVVKTGATADSIFLRGNGAYEVSTAGGDDFVRVGDEEPFDTTPGKGGEINVGDGTNSVSIFDDGAATIVSGSGADTVYVASTTSGSHVINTGAGADAITHLGSGNSTITPGLGADTVNLVGSSGHITVVIANGDSGLGQGAHDTIVNFDAANDALDMAIAGTDSNFIRLNPVEFPFNTYITLANQAMQDNPGVSYVLIENALDIPRYLFVDRNNDDIVDFSIELIGLDFGEFQASNII